MLAGTPCGITGPVWTAYGFSGELLAALVLARLVVVETKT